MNVKERKKVLPAECVCAWFFAFLLTISLTITLLGSMTLQMTTSSGLHLSVAADDGMLDRQFQEISEKIDRMATEYGFDASRVKATISRDELKEFNRNTAEWWTRLLTEGEKGAIPRWYTGSIEDLIYAESEEKELGEAAQTIVKDITAVIEDTVIPVRETILTFGTKAAKEKADIRGILQSVQKMPMLGLMTGLICAGMIVLLLGREIILTLKYYGTAFAAAGLIVLAACIAFIVSRPARMIAEASTGLAEEFCVLANKITLGAGLTAVILLSAGYLGLYFYRRKAENVGSETGLSK